MPFEPGQSGNPAGRPVGALGKKTIEKQDRRAIFDAAVSQVYEEIIIKARPEYLLDQFIGKAEEKLELSGSVDTTNGLTPELIAKAKELLKQELIKPNADTTVGQPGNSVLPKGT